MARRGDGTVHAAKIHSSSRSLPSAMDTPNPSFFRIILPYMLEKKKLKLPLKFVKMHCSELSSSASLTLPNGRVWKVGLEKVITSSGDDDDDEEIWFGDGWAEFVEHHSISEGYFLVFEYLGRLSASASAFTVSIFDFTTCSIKYPVNDQLDEGMGSPPNCIVISDDEDDEPDHPSTRKKLREKTPRAMTAEIKKTLKCLKASGIATNSLFHLNLPKIYTQCKKGIEEAIASKPRERPCFMVVLNAHQICGNSRIVIPSWFGREHKIQRRSNRSGILEVCNNGGQQWSVEVARNESLAGMFMGKGWGKFMEDNNLGEGDVCLFQLVSAEEPVKMNVSIFPAQHWSIGLPC